MNIEEFKEWISQFPDDAIVEVVTTLDDSCYGTQVFTEEFTGKEFHDYELLDFTNNQFMTPDNPSYGKKIIILGRNS